MIRLIHYGENIEILGVTVALCNSSYIFFNFCKINKTVERTVTYFIIYRLFRNCTIYWMVTKIVQRPDKKSVLSFICCMLMFFLFFL